MYVCTLYFKKGSTEARPKAATRVDKKVGIYRILSDNYHFVPVGAETYCAYGPQGIKIIKQIGKKIQEGTCEKLSNFFLLQSISMAIPWDKSVCVMGCPKMSIGSQGLFNFHVQEAEHTGTFYAQIVQIST